MGSRTPLARIAPTSLAARFQHPWARGEGIAPRAAETRTPLRFHQQSFYDANRPGHHPIQ